MKLKSVFLFVIITKLLGQNITGTVTVTDIDGNIYKTIKIGEQWWMAENLKVKHYRNGDLIPNVAGPSEWCSLSKGAWCTYDNKEEFAHKYGYLYNWFAIEDNRNIAPENWHVPNNEEWQVLIDYLGGFFYAGGKMKANGNLKDGTGLWDPPNEDATNESGFSALPSGGRPSFITTCVEMGEFAIFWASTEYDSTKAWIRTLVHDSPGTGNLYINIGCSWISSKRKRTSNS